MPKPAATLNDPATHPGKIVSACARHHADNGELIAREGDVFMCIEHGPQPIVHNLSDNVEVEGERCARDGSIAACGAVIKARATSPLV